MRYVLVAMMLLSACGDDDVALDAGDAGDGGVVEPPAPIGPMPPAEAALPVFGMCPAGWTKRATREGIDVCDPYAVERRSCGFGTVQLPGDPACQPLGAACPEDVYATDLPSEGVVFVSSGALDGDGTRARPFGTIAAAVSAAPEGATIAIGKGSYAEAVVLGRDVDLVGACVTETRIEAPVGEAAIATLEATIAVRGLTVGATGPPCIDVNGGSVRVQGVELEPRAGSDAITATGAELRVERTAIRFASSEVELMPGRGIACADARCTARSVAIFGAAGEAILAQGGMLEVERAVVTGEGEGVALTAEGSDTRATVHAFAAYDLGAGAIAADGAFLSLDQGYFSGHSGPAFTDIESETTLSRVVFEGGTDGPILSIGGKTTLRDVVVRDTTGGSPSVHAIAGAEIDLERLALDHNDEGVWSEEATLRGSDLVIRDTMRGEVPGAIALVVFEHATLERVRIERAEVAGVVLVGATDTTLSDLIVRDSGAGQIEGAGLEATRSTATLARASFDGNSVASIVARNETHLTASDLHVAHTLARMPAGDLGVGIQVVDDSTAAFERVLVEDSRDHGVLVQSDSEATFVEGAILDSKSNDCAVDECAMTPGGIGAGAYDAHVAFDRFAIRTASLCGLYVGIEGAIDVMSGLVAESAVGACVDAEDYAIDRLMNGVLYRDNTQNLSSLRLPVPAPAPPIPVTPPE